MQELTDSDSLAVKSFLQEQRLELAGKTGAWDLGSLLVKPVQRVLKYPLLLKSCLKNTHEDHIDIQDLQLAVREMECVAELINTVKKRKDVVDKYVKGKQGQNILHGISKKWTRGAQQLKRNIGMNDDGLEGDALFDALVERFEEFAAMIPQIGKQFSAWCKALKDQFAAEESFANSLHAAFSQSQSLSKEYRDTLILVNQFKEACARLYFGPCKVAVICYLCRKPKSRI